MIILCLLSHTPTTVDSHMNKEKILCFHYRVNFPLFFLFSPNSLPQYRNFTVALNNLSNKQTLNGWLQCPHLAKLSLNSIYIGHIYYWVYTYIQHVVLQAIWLFSFTGEPDNQITAIIFYRAMRQQLIC